MSTAVADYEQEIDGEVVEIQDAGTALMALNKSEIDIQIATAKQYPRSIKQFKADALDMATLDEETAASMFYSLPRAGNRIEGPSVRLAEVVGSSFGNLRYSARIVEIGDSFVTAQGMCFDLQKNIAASVEAKRRITDKRGRRFNDDMIQVTCNAACSIALRGAIFKVVPFAFVKPIFEQAKLTAIGKAESVIDRRNKAVAWFKKLGATEQQLLDMLGRKGWDDVTTDDLVSLRGLATAIKDGETTIEDALRPKDHGGPRAGVSALNDKLAPKNPPDEQAVKHESAQPHASDPLATLKAACSEAYEQGDLAAFSRLNDDWCGPDARWTDDPEQFREAGKMVAEWRAKLEKSPSAGKRSQKQASDTAASATEAGH